MARSSPRVRRLVAFATLLAAGGCGAAQVQAPRYVPRRSVDRVHAGLAARADGQLHAGAAVVDATPPGDVWLGGGKPGRRSRGVADPLTVRALYLDDGRQPLVVVVADGIGLLDDDAREARGRVSARWADAVVLAATHDHGAPDTVGVAGRFLAGRVMRLTSGRDPAYVRLLADRIAEAVDRAAEAAGPARIRAGTAAADPTLCRNVHEESPADKDDTVRVLAVEHADGTPLAVLANWGCDADAGGDGERVTADWPGVFHRRWERAAGGVAIFVQGALGGHVAPDPRALPVDAAAGRDPGVALAERVGNGFADAVLAAVRAAGEARGPAGVEIAVAGRRLRLPDEEARFAPLVARDIVRRTIATSANRTWLASEVVAARIRAGGAVVADLAGLPGQASPAVVREADASAAAPVVLDVSLAGDDLGDLLPGDAAGRWWHDHERAASPGVRTAARVLEALRAIRDGL